MNDFDFKNALISKMKISNRYLYDKNKVTKVLEECDFNIKYTSEFTRKVWNTYCAILKITVPVESYEFIINRKKKVRYSVSKYQKGGPITMSGTGYITETDLVIACTNKYGKLYVRIFEDALKYCFPIIDKNNEFKGNVTEYHDITVNVGEDSTEIVEIQTEYKVWYKLVD